MKAYKTAKGTELPIILLKGKEYLEVKYRLVWFREEHPSYGIETDIVAATETGATARAVIKDESGRIIATSHKSETQSGFPDFMEKAETGAIGRALALVGFGTQFCADELDEGKRIVDSPVPPKSGPRPSLQAVPAPASYLGAFVLKFGKYTGKRLDEITVHELDGYCAWLKKNAKPGQDDSAIRSIEAFLKTREPKGAQK